MGIIDAVLLGLLQALGEFLPISSSAHLVLLPYLRGQEYQGLSFDVMLHAATLLAVLLYFWRDWWMLLKQGLTAPKSREGRLLWYLAVATVPAAVVGFLFNDWAESTFRNPALIAVNLIVFAGVLWWADKKANKQSTDLFDVPFLTVFLIGCAQALGIRTFDPGGFQRRVTGRIYQRIYRRGDCHRRVDEIHQITHVQRICVLSLGVGDCDFSGLFQLLIRPSGSSRCGEGPRGS